MGQKQIEAILSRSHFLQVVHFFGISTARRAPNANEGNHFKKYSFAFVGLSTARRVLKINERDNFKKFVFYVFNLLV